jgi:hypothetical protein
MIINRIYENQNFLSLQIVSFLDGLRTYQHPWYLSRFLKLCSRVLRIFLKFRKNILH